MFLRFNHTVCLSLSRRFFPMNRCVALPPNELPCCTQPETARCTQGSPVLTRAQRREVERAAQKGRMAPVFRPTYRSCVSNPVDWDSVCSAPKTSREILLARQANALLYTGLLEVIRSERARGYNTPEGEPSFEDFHAYVEHVSLLPRSQYDDARCAFLLTVLGPSSPTYQTLVLQLHGSTKVVPGTSSLRLGERTGLQVEIAAQDTREKNTPRN